MVFPLRKRLLFLVIHFQIRFQILITWEEQRFIIIGLSEQGRIIVAAHTDDGEVVRIISAREATHGEREAYEES
jgi:uncharacterized DUF497 family protein